MLKISLIINSNFYLNNRIFDENNLVVNRDDCQRHFIELRKMCFIEGISLNTYDINTIEDCDIALFLNTPSPENEIFKKAIHLNKICFLIVNELEYIHKENMNTRLHSNFKKIFTYQDKLIDNIKYFKINYSFDFKKKIFESKQLPYVKKNLAVMIAGFKALEHPNELYSKRIQTIKWFEKHHLSKFDLYGMGWNQKTGFMKSFFTYNYKSYKGSIVDKSEILNKYKFNICYENAIRVKGWITEKIFDSLFAKCIPVYWGCDTISKYVNSNCYIDRNNFNTDGEMYDYLKNINEDEYNNYIYNIELYLRQASANPLHEFSIHYFITTIINQIKIDFLYNEQKF